MFKFKKQTYSEDMFADTRMSFGDHLEDLRTHLWRAVKGFGVALFLSFFIGHLVLNFITAPVKAELKKFYDHRTRKLLAEKGPDADGQLIRRPSPFIEV